MNAVMKSGLTPACSAVLLLLFSTAPSAVEAQFSYIVSNGTVTITGYIGPGGDLVIPGTINGLRVIALGDGAFRYQRTLNSVTIPDRVTDIGYQAFGDCTNLAGVSMGGGLTRIQSSAFWNCARLACINIPDAVTNIGDLTFHNCTSLTNVTIGRGVQRIAEGYIESWGIRSIGARAFSGCTSLAAITVDPLNAFFSSVDGVLFNKARTILIAWPGAKPGAFTIPSGVTNLEEYAFRYCGNLTTLTIPASLAYISYPGFWGCTNLVAIDVEPLNPVFSSTEGILFSKNHGMLRKYPGSRRGSYTIPDYVTSLGFGAFGDCVGLTSIAIPFRITSIAEYAFLGCSGLTNIAFPSTLRGIEELAFSDCASLSTVVIPSGLLYIADGGFARCPSLSGVYFQGNAPASIWYWEGPFWGSTNVTVYYLPGTTGWTNTFGGRPTAVWTWPPVADASATEATVISGNSLNAFAVLDGTRSSDPDGDRLEYLWLSTLGSQPSTLLATGSVAVVVLPVGLTTVQLVVSDGVLSNTNSVTIEVLPAAEAVQRLIVRVASSCPRPKPLVASLSAALASLERGHSGTAANQLGAFQNKVGAQVGEPALAQEFIQAAQRIRDAL